jgi:hypothetical protein
MLNWNDIEKTRLHREDLLREASAEHHAQEVDRPRQSLWPLLALLVAVQHWLQAS